MKQHFMWFCCSCERQGKSCCPAQGKSQDNIHHAAQRIHVFSGAASEAAQVVL